MNFLKKADFFGVPFLQNINQQQALFKSTLGGLLSLLISVTSLAYAFWIIYLWKSNQMSPKISNSKYVSDYKLLDYNSGRISVYYEVFEGQVDPFESRILLPLVMYTDQFAPTEPMIIENYIESSIGKQYQIQIWVILLLMDIYKHQNKCIYSYLYAKKSIQKKMKHVVQLNQENNFFNSALIFSVYKQNRQLQILEMDQNKLQFKIYISNQNCRVVILQIHFQRQTFLNFRIIYYLGHLNKKNILVEQKYVQFK